MIQTATLLHLLKANNIIVFMLVFTRLTGLVQSAPFFSTLRAPMMAKIWFAAIIAFILYPLIVHSKAFLMPHDMVEFSILLLIEFSIGYLIGFGSNLIIEGARMAGNIISIQMGLSMSQALDPATGINEPELSNLYVYLTVLIFLATGAYQILFVTMFNSFNSIPMGVFPAFNSEIVNSMISLFGQLFKISFGIALPIFSVLLMCDVLLGMMNKVMPQMNIYMVSIPVKIYIGLILFMAFLNATSLYLKDSIGGYLKAVGALFN